MTHLSLSDRRAIDELKKERERLFSEASSQRLLSELRRRLQSITQDIYIIRSIAEQGEDLYDILVDGATVVHIEIPRTSQNGETVFETCSVEEYLKDRPSLLKRERRKLELILRLSREGGAALK
jgi:hypothetical protein